jgi:hypothetical protein
MSQENSQIRTEELGRRKTAKNNKTVFFVTLDTKWSLQPRLRHENMIGAELLIAMLLPVSAGETTSMKGFFNFCTHYDQLFCRAKGLLE